MPVNAIEIPIAGEEIDASWGLDVATALNGIVTGQAGVTGNGTSSKALAITFPVVFAASPLVFVSIATNTNLYIVGGSSATTTGFTINVSRKDGADWTTTITVNWLAIGKQA